MQLMRLSSLIRESHGTANAEGRMLAWLLAAEHVHEHSQGLLTNMRDGHPQ